ncbi:MAG: hypothetical protein JKY65_02155 [Planctomycetes bacterium]|nr:hypothetical protein [Planctomycetota bacterium]
MPSANGYPLPAPAAGPPITQSTLESSGSSSGIHGSLPDTPAPRERYFEDVTELVVRTLDAVEGDSIIGWAHDRVDPDTMGANGLLWYLLRERYQKSYCCYYSKRMSFLMNRSLVTNFMPSGVLRRCEATENLSEVAHKAELIVVLDATSPEIMTDFSHLLRRSAEIREKPILFIDHHRRGKSDIETLPNANGVRNEGGQATSAIMLHVLLNLGLELGQDDETFRLAVVTRAGIETDLIGVDPSGYAASTIAALDYLDTVLGERGRAILNKLSSIKHPPGWYRKLGQALTQVGDYDSNIAIAGLGVINDTGIVPFVANRLMEMGPYKTTIVFAIVYDVVDGQIVSIDLDASGRSSADTEIVLADLFHDLFYVTDSDNRRTPKGGGRANKLLGDFSGAGASVPLDYWRHINCRSADEKKAILTRMAWPAEFLRIRHLLTQRIPSLKAEEIRSVDPIDVLEGL